MPFETSNIKHHERIYNLDGQVVSSNPVDYANGTPVYATDYFTFSLSDSSLGTGGPPNPIVIGDHFGFYFKKSSDSSYDSFYDWVVTGKSGSLYSFSKTYDVIAGFTPPNFYPPGYLPNPDSNRTNLSMGGYRNFADTYFAEPEPENFPFGDWDLKVYYASNPTDLPGEGDGTINLFQFPMRGLAITNLKATPERIEVDGVVRQVTITGDITVYPNQTTNGVAGWTPTGPIDWRVIIKNPTVPQSQWVTINSTPATAVIPTAPDSDGIVGSFTTTWNGFFSTADGPPYDQDDTAFVQMDIEARAMVTVGTGRNTVTPVARAGVGCKKCQNKMVNSYAEFGETISIFDDTLSALDVTFSYSSSESSNPKGSMGYGWFSTENIKIFRPFGDDTDLVYCDETGMCRRWLKNGAVYDPVLADNKMTLTVGAAGNAKYVVRWRDGSQREFDTAGNLRKHVNSNGHATVYDRQTTYLSISDGKGRTVYIHFDSGQVQPSVINDNVDRNLGRRYLLEYELNGTEQTQLKSITDPVGDKTVYVYVGGRIVERRQELASHHRSVYYAYDRSNTGRLASLKVSSKDLSTSVVTDHYRVDYAYNVPFSYDKDGAGPEPPVVYNTTKTTIKDLQDLSNPDRVSYIAHDSLSRIVGEFEDVLDDLDNDNQIDDLTFIATLHEYTDLNDPWLRTKTIQINKTAETSYQYTPRGNLKKIIDAQLNETTMTYVEQVPGHPAAATFPDLVTEIVRPAYDRTQASTTTYPSTRFNYDPINGNLLSIEDANVLDVNGEFTFDRANGNGQLTYFGYNSDGQVTRIVNRRGFKTYITYDAKARLSEVRIQKGLTPSALSITNFASEPTPGDFRLVTLTYDAYDNIVKVEDANSNKIEITAYDNVDRPLTVKDGNGVDYLFGYLDQVLKEVTLPDNNVVSANVRKAKIGYDSAGRPLAVNREDSSNPSQLRVGFTYDGFSQLRSLVRLKNGSPKAHTAQYDRQGRTVATVDANGKTSTAAYEPYCVGFATTSARGVRRTASFDSLCRLTEVKVGSPHTDPLQVAVASETRNFTHDDLGRVTGTSQATSGASIYGVAKFGQSSYGSGGVAATTRSYEYDSLDRVTRVTFEDGKTMDYLYDFEGNVTQVTENASSATPKVTQFSYYGDNRLHQVTYVRPSGNQVFTYAYDLGGRPLTLTYPTSTGIVAHFSGPTGQVGWDGNGQLKHLRYMKGTNTVRRFEFSYDDAGNRITQFDFSPAKATYWAYSYDWLDRLETVKKVETTNTTILVQIQDLPAADALPLMGALQLVSVYSYDAADNRYLFEVPNLSNPALTETFTYSFDDADNILSVSKAVGVASPSVIETFTSDDDGNLLTKTDLATSVVTEYKWTDHNRLASIETKLAGVSTGDIKQSNTFGVNGFRRKKKDKDDIETTEYAAGLATAVSKAQGGDTVTYLMGHRLMGFERSSDGAMFWFITDALSTVRDVVSSTGAMVASYEFSEYGQRIASSESGVSSQKTFVGGSSVQDEVADTGLMMMGHRFYDADLGRFLNRDPIGFRGGPSLFAYSNNRPVTETDPSGLLSAPFWWTVGTIGAGTVAYLLYNQSEIDSSLSLVDFRQANMNLDQALNLAETTTYAADGRWDSLNEYIDAARRTHKVVKSRRRRRQAEAAAETSMNCKVIEIEPGYAFGDHSVPFLAQSLTHEGVHVTRGTTWNLLHPNRKEWEAYSIANAHFRWQLEEVWVHLSEEQKQTLFSRPLQPEELSFKVAQPPEDLPRVPELEL